MNNANAGWSLVAGLAVFYFLHVLIWNLRPSNAPRVILLKFLMAVGLVVTLLTYGFTSGFHISVLFILASVVMCIDMCYMYFYSGIARSVSITILDRLNEKKMLSFNGLVNDYTSSSRFKDRLVVMQNTGVLKMAGDHISLTPKGITVAKGIRILSLIFSGRLEG